MKMQFVTLRVWINHRWIAEFSVMRANREIE
jgi:hypothetical protein